MPILDQLQKDLVAAMKAKEEARLSAIRMIKTALQKGAADAAKPLDDAAEQQILKILVKQRSDAAEMFRKAGREEQALKEEARLSALRMIKSALQKASADSPIMVCTRPASAALYIPPAASIRLITASISSSIRSVSAST